MSNIANNQNPTYINVVELQRNQIALAEALDRLNRNEDFIKVIKLAYMQSTLLNEAKNLVSTDKDSAAVALDKLKAVTYFQSFLDMVQNDGLSATEDLLDFNSRR